ncbi:MAG: lytic polysaccharide monooxygenase [Plesiomonas sp.]|uniref:lytic polysaccharide monooxygenase n=1 Tax=Plesiomonas sp. TaxID=2486279 RepID=UPI003F3E56DA
MKKLKPILFTLSSLTVALTSAHVNAHGYMVSPQDYAYSCSEGTTSGQELCNGTVSQQKNEINQGDAAGDHKKVLMDGKICSASKGGAYGVLDVPSSQRHTTKLKRDKDGKIEIQYIPTAAHKTWYWDYFVTRDGFNPDTDTLTWADLERIDVINAKGDAPNGGVWGQMHTQKIKWPADKTGKRILFQVWQRPNPSHKNHEELGAPPSNIWDSSEAFYSCANVIVDTGEGGGTEPPVVENPWQNSEPFASASTAVDIGYTVVARLMNKGSEQFKIPLKITAENILNNKWKIELAEKINKHTSASKFAQVGEVNSDYQVTLNNTDPTQNYIHFTGKEWTHLIESHNNETPEIAFSMNWTNHKETYEFAANQPLSVPFSLSVTEQVRLIGKYNYTAVVKEVGVANQEPIQVLQGLVPDNGVSENITVKKPGTYSVNVTVTNEKGKSESNMYSFGVVVNNTPPVTGDFDYVFPDGLKSYVAGTKVKGTDGNIYECKPWPYSGYCQQWTSSSNAYEPGVGFAWEQAWTLVK